MYYSTEYDSPVGRLTLASDGQAICGLWLEGQKYHGAGIAGELERNDQASGFDELRAWLDAYFAGARPVLEKVPLAPIGSEFQRLLRRGDNVRSPRRADSARARRTPHGAPGRGGSGGP